MLRASVHAVLHHLRQTVGPAAAGGLTDGQLFERWAARRDEAALEVLLWRHGPMVLGVCRRVLRHEQDAEDAFQATFLTLVRGAGAVRDGQALADWLHRVAHRVALAARATARRRPLHVHPLPDVPAAPPDDFWHDFGPVLDEEVGRLPEKYRRPFVLCYLEGRTNEEAARELGCPRGTVCTRLTWARERLRSRLARRGVTLSAAALAAALARPASAAELPSGLADGTVRTAVAFAAGRASAAATRAAALARQVAEAALPARLRAAAVLALVAGVLAVGVGWAGLQEEPPREPRPAPALQADPAPQVPAKPRPAPRRDLKPVRAALARRNGGTAESEAAVDAGLKWLAAQQAEDGHWSLGPAQKNDVAATSFALLALLGAGITHQDGKDGLPECVERGLNYLVKAQAKDGRLGTDTMYTHGIATLTLCHAYALTSDPKLEGPARRAFEFDVAAQSKRGGWRYLPGGADADTSVTGWQVQALAMGRFAGFEVPKATADGAMRYLDTAQAPDGGYGYIQPRSTPTMTASGLLSRLELGWDEHNPAVQSGLAVLRLSPPGTRKSLYHDYYATQVMFLAGGKDWEEWNPKMRDLLVKGQEGGRWSPAGDTFTVNSPLMATALALITLEVYYRYDLILERRAPEKLTEKELERMWTRLGEVGGFERKREVAQLALRQKEVVPFLAERLRPAKTPTAAEQERAGRLIKDLDDDEFAVREAASEGLEKMGAAAETALRRALEAGPVAEVRRRVERLLDKYADSGAEDGRRARRALEVLERSDTSEAWAVIERLAKGPAGVWLTDEARTVLHRRECP